MRNIQFKIYAGEDMYIKPSKKRGYVYTGCKGDVVLNNCIFPHYRQAAKYLKNYFKERGIQPKKHKYFKSAWKYEVCKNRKKSVFSFHIFGNIY